MRRTTRVLYDAMTKGPVQLPSAARRTGSERVTFERGPAGGFVAAAVVPSPLLGSAARSGESPYGSATARRATPSSRDMIACCRIESIVPPERPPLSRRTKSVVLCSSPSPRSFAARAVRSTPRSDGTESKPHDGTIFAPVRWATSWKASATSWTKSTSPVRSQ